MGKVSVLFRGVEEEIEYDGVKEVTFINGGSHGQGPAGASLNASTRRLILHSNDAMATFIEGDK